MLRAIIRCPFPMRDNVSGPFNYSGLFPFLIRDGNHRTLHRRRVKPPSTPSTRSLWNTVERLDTRARFPASHIQLRGRLS